MKVHLIAIGGSAMHNLAIALHLAAHQVSGSDDEIYDPAKSRLASFGLLPDKFGWYPERINREIDLIILGMHAKKDNPELLEAIKLGIRVLSYPEFIFEQSRDKQRIVIAGSHGKTTTTSMIMHALKYNNVDFDYLVGAQISGFDVMVKISGASTIIIEGDEYLSSCIDQRPKFLHYKPHIAVLTGIAWDHINVFPEFSEYVRQFELFANSLEDGGKLIWYSEDRYLSEIASNCKDGLKLIPYNLDNFVLSDHYDGLIYEGVKYSYSFFGKHNMENMVAAAHVCEHVGISPNDFFASMQHFEGASKRLQTYISDENLVVLFDFAHAPSKVRASIHAVKKRYEDLKLKAVLELHTFSSLNMHFIEQYAGSMNEADEAVVLFDRHTLKMKNMEDLDKDEVARRFSHKNISVFDDKMQFEQWLNQTTWSGSCFLFMSSGNFGGIDIKGIAVSHVE